MSVAPWFQEEVRRELEKRFGSRAGPRGRPAVETTLDLDLQQTANRAVPTAWLPTSAVTAGRAKLENVLDAGKPSRTIGIPTGL
jgi:penicillin-binding protein 1A